MPVTFEMLEEFDGTRTTEMPDPDNEGETISTTDTVRDVQVKFTCDDVDPPVEHIRSVNVSYTDGQYDPEETANVIQQVANGVGHKVRIGVIA